MTKRTENRSSRWSPWLLAGLFVLPALPTHGQYVGKVGQGIDKKPALRATAVYEYTGSIAKPSASRLVPVVVWDGERYQPGGLYLAQPEPLAVAPGTQYVLMQTGIPSGYFNISSAGQLAGAWVGLGRFAPQLPPPPPKKLAASKKLPVLSGGSGRGRAGRDEDSGSGPVLHRKAGSEGDTAPAKPSSSPPASTGSETGNSPTLHRRDSSSTTGSGTSPAPPPPPPDPDRPTLHRPASSSSSGSSAPPVDPDRPTLHRHNDAAPAASAGDVPDPDRPHLRYGRPAELEARVLPMELKDSPEPGVKVGELAAISDTVDDEPHSFKYAWPSTTAQADALQAMHALALRALADSVKATFGPAAKENTALKQAADAAESSLKSPRGSSTAPAQKRVAHPATILPVDPLADADFHAFELSYGGGATYVYTANTANAGPDRRYVTVIAQPDFYGKPHAVFAQTTRADMLTQTPALRLVDAVDADGDHRAELLFSQQTIGGTATGPENNDAGRQFALYSVAAGAATEVFSTTPGTR